jgi:TonB family protein
MTPSLWLRDIVSLTVQLTFVVVTGAAVFYALCIRDARVSLIYWRSLLLLCLLLPVCQPWATTPSPMRETGPRPSRIETALEDAVAQPAAMTRSLTRMAISPQAVLWGVAAGAAARSFWLMLGAWRLRSLRRTASILEPLPASVRRAQTHVGVAARILVSERLAGPITFGFFDPVVILPPWINSVQSHVQEAIACHELIHVRRRDWLDEILEEVVRSLFWFHPAVRWLIGRVQLSREQVVDQCAIQLTASRERYVDALLVVALTTSPVALVPAPLFLRRHLLKRRIAQILEHTTMTTRRLIASFTVGGAALALTIAGAVRAFPLEAQAQAPSREAIQIVKGGEHLLHASMPEYPRRAIEQRIEGEVTLDLTLNETGEVSDARVVSGPDELRKAALESVLQWHYSPSDLRSTNTLATLRFQVPDGSAEFAGRRFQVASRSGGQDSAEDQEKKELSPVQRGERLMMELEEALADTKITSEQRAEYEHKYAEVKEALATARGNREKLQDRGFERPSRLVQIKTERLPRETVAEIVAQAGISLGDLMTEDVARRIKEATHRVDEHLRVSFGGDGKGGTVLAIIAP